MPAVLYFMVLYIYILGMLSNVPSVCPGLVDGLTLEHAVSHSSGINANPVTVVVYRSHGEAVPLSQPSDFLQGERANLPSTFSSQWSKHLSLHFWFTLIAPLCPQDMRPWLLEGCENTVRGTLWSLG